MAEAAQSDDASSSLHHGLLTTGIASLLEGRKFETLYDLAKAAATLSRSLDQSVRKVAVEASAGNQFPHAEALDVMVETSPREREFSVCWRHAAIRNLNLYAVLGANQLERREKQLLILDVTFYLDGVPKPDWVQVQLDLVRTMGATSYFTLEAFAADVARVALNLVHSVEEVAVRVRKPSSSVAASSTGVQVSRCRQKLVGWTIPPTTA